MGWDQLNPFAVLSGGNDGAKSGIQDIYHGITDDPAAAGEAERKKKLAEQAAAAGQFAGVGEGNYNQGTADLNAQRDYLRRIASGQDSLSAMQLQQGLQQNVAAQQSMAAGASPMNGPMAARQAAMNAARLGAGMSGQAAMAGLQERRDANNALSNMMLGQRGQDVNVATGSRQNALSGYGAGNAGQPPKSDIEKYGPAAIAALQLFSDRNLKTDIVDGDEKANRALDGLRAYAYKYKNEYGRGEQLGVIAQDLPRIGLGQAVLDTPDGKAIDPGKLSGANTAMLAALARRVGKLEGQNDNRPSDRRSSKPGDADLIIALGRKVGKGGDGRSG